MSRPRRPKRPPELRPSTPLTRLRVRKARRRSAKVKAGEPAGTLLGKDRAYWFGEDHDALA